MGKILHLVLKEEWFNKIKSGEKRVEYREFKEYWTNRIMNKGCLPRIAKFKLGYASDAETMIFRIKELKVLINENNDLGLPKVWAIELGPRIRACMKDRAHHNCYNCGYQEYCESFCKLEHDYYGKSERAE